MVVGLGEKCAWSQAVAQAIVTDRNSVVSRNNYTLSIFIQNTTIKKREQEGYNFVCLRTRVQG